MLGTTGQEKGGMYQGAQEKGIHKGKFGGGRENARGFSLLRLESQIIYALSVNYRTRSYASIHKSQGYSGYVNLMWCAFCILGVFRTYKARACCV